MAVVISAVLGLSLGPALPARGPLRARLERSPLMTAADHFEYLVIGGGSGGIASARRAAAHGAKVGVIERERLGGTCVNVGCVPKKVMFNTGSMMQFFHQAAGYGFELGEIKFSWPEIKRRRDAYVKRLNGIYAGNLDKSGVKFITGDAKFKGPKEVDVGGVTYTADNVLIAVGGKPSHPDIPGAELAIDSNGFFELEELPGKVIVVGSGYIAVELAGILQLLGSEVELLIRGDRPLRTMDATITDQLVTEMKEEEGRQAILAKIMLAHSHRPTRFAMRLGVHFLKGEVASIAMENGKKTVTLKSGEVKAGYDVVLFAIGRTPVTDSLNLSAAGIEATRSGHICVDKASRTTAEGVYAVGDVIGTGVDLTPTAIAAGRLLSDRLFAGVPEEQTIMDYEMVPTVVGLTEAQALERFGAEAVTIHKTTFVNMLYSREFLVEGQFQPKTMAKLVCIGPEQRIVGLHMIGFAVDEILQGFSVAIKMGATKADFDSVVAIHPTSAEELVTIPPWQAKYKMSSSPVS